MVLRRQLRRYEANRGQSASHSPSIVVATPSIVPPFATQDARLLSGSFNVSVLPIAGIHSVGRLWSVLGKCDAMVVWFLGRHALPAVILARLRGIPVVSIIGGFEVAWVPQIGYGIRPKSIRDRVLHWMVLSSRQVLSVSAFSRGETVSRFPELANRITLVANAVDTERFSLPDHRARSGVICVGSIVEETIAVKSWRLFRDVARAMPNTPFTIVGRADDAAGRSFVSDLPGNVKWLGPLKHDDVVGALQSAGVYVQLSLYESFCVSVVEAMSCGCFPVVSGFGALPEVVGNAGEVLPDLRVSTIVNAIQAGLRRPETDRELVRQRVIDNFGVGRRRDLLVHCLESVLAHARC